MNKHRLDVRRLAMQGALKVGFQNVVVRAIGFLGNLVLARLLLPRQFGVLALGLTITTVIAVGGAAGLAAALIRGRREPSRADLGFVEGLQLSAGLGAALVLVTLAPVFGSTALVAAIMATGFAITAAQAPAAVLLERDLVYGPIAVAGVIAALLQSLVSVMLVIAGYGVYGVAIASPVSAVFSAVVLVRLSGRGWVAPNLNFAASRHLLTEGSWFASQDLVVLVRDQGQNVLVAALGGLATLGQWAFATRILLIPYVLLTSLWQVSFPAMARMRDQGQDANSTVRLALRLTAMGLGLPVAVLAGPTVLLVEVLFGIRWAPSETVIALVCLNYMISGPLSVAGGGQLFALGKVRTVVLSGIAHTFAQLGLSAVLFGWLGLGAVGIGSVVAALIEATVFYVALDLDVGGLLLSQLPSWAACGAGCLVGRVLAASLPGDIVGLVVSEAAVVAAYLLCLLILGPPEFRRALRLLTSFGRRGGDEVLLGDVGGRDAAGQART